MNRIVVYPQSTAPDVITAAFADREPVLVHSKSECAEALVAQAAIDCLIVQRDVYGPEYQAFFSSLKLHFPFLEIVLIAPQGQTPLPDGCHFIDGSLEDADITRRTAAFLQAPRMADHRHGIRFDWPLRGLLTVGGEEASCKVRAFSSSGAFLQTDVEFQTGSEATLRVEFLNSHMTVHCENVRWQEAAAGGPAGYGVRFLDLSAQARELSERIVRDAVIRALLHPEKERRAPSLSSEELMIPGFEQS